MRLLLLEDDARLAVAVRAWMGHGGVEVDWITEGGDAEPALRRRDYDCLVLDLGLPDMAGDEVLLRLRGAGFELPVVVTTARERVADRIRLLDLGADDFLVKPVHLDELAARVRAVTRRGSGRDPEIRLGGLSVNLAARIVVRGGVRVALTNSEFSVLETLLRHRGRTTTREQLEEALYGWGEAGASNALEVHVHHLRRKLGPGLIRTVRGEGYALRSEG